MTKQPLSVYMVRINDRPYGFNVVAICASDVEEAKSIAASRCGADWREKWPGGNARVVDSAVVERGASVSMEFEE